VKRGLAPLVSPDKGISLKQENPVSAYY